jgi:caffeoyl-CoA O-methyltransferase
LRPQAVPLRPVTPLGIIARNLALLAEHEQAASKKPPDFPALLAETARMANGLEDYLAASSTPASSALTELAANTIRHDWNALHAAGSPSLPLESEMVSGHLEGQLLKILVRATKATRILEIGCFTGYSALAMAEALPDDGILVACEIDAYAASVARQAFDRSPHGRKITIEVAPAMQTLTRLRDAGDQFDFVFIDADKARYTAYFDLVVGSTLLTQNGLICVDNTLMQGEPYLSRPRSANGEAIAEFNAVVANDPRVEQVLVPIRDGLTLIARVAT